MVSIDIRDGVPGALDVTAPAATELRPSVRVARPSRRERRQKWQYSEDLFLSYPGVGWREVRD